MSLSPIDSTDCFAVEKQAGTLVLGDVRDVADGTTRGKRTNQQLSQWSHGQLRQYLTYKAEQAGITVRWQHEAYTSQTCPGCQTRHKPKGQTYRCPACGFVGHRDGQVGAANILSAALHGEPGHSLFLRSL